MGKLLTIPDQKIPVNIIGQKIKNLRKMTQEEMDFEGWSRYDNECPYCIELENGLTLYPSQDYEGNSYGVWFGRNKKEKKNRQGFTL